MKCDYAHCPEPDEPTHMTVVGLEFHPSCQDAYWGVETTIEG